MDPRTLATFEHSLARCMADPAFLDHFYQRFLSASPRVQEKFAGTDFERQKAALRASFDLLLRAARDGAAGPETHLRALADRHGAGQLAIGAEFYDYWLDSLLETVRLCDAEWSESVLHAWEAVMGVGIRYMVSRYHNQPR